MISQVDHPILEVFDLTVSYDSEPALLNANFGIPKGKMVGIVGPNGAGKSTLLKSVMGLVDNVSGLVKVFNKI
jgi:manganese/zinc/iron transport system ATP- binding protein